MFTQHNDLSGNRLTVIVPCIGRKDRITIQEKEKEQQKLKDLEVEVKKLANERRQQTLKVRSFNLL